MDVLSRRRLSEQDVRQALDTVLDPELDEPITDLGFVRSVQIADERVVVHLRLPTSFCSPNFAYLMASDAKDALVPLAREVVIELDDHHDSGLINLGLAADAGYKGTFGTEAEDSLDELRMTFRRKAHTAAMERALAAVAGLSPAAAFRVTLGDIPEGRERQMLLRRRAALGYGLDDDAAVLVDDNGAAVTADKSELLVRRARSVRISVDGNAHFCRGLLRTRYPDSGADQAPRADDQHLLLPMVASGCHA